MKESKGSIEGDESENSKGSVKRNEGNEREKGKGSAERKDGNRSKESNGRIVSMETNERKKGKGAGQARPPLGPSGLLGLFLILLATVLLLSFCDNKNDRSDEAAPSPTATHTDAPTATHTDAPTATQTDAPAGTPGSEQQSGSGEARIRLERLQPWTEFASLAGLEHAPGDSSALYALEQAGRILKVPLGDGAGDGDAGNGENSGNGDNPSRSASGGNELFLDIADRVFSEGSEQGLLGLAFHPDYESNGFFYVNYTTPTHTVISRFQAGGSPDTGDPGSERILLTFEQPYSNHNGGQLAFGPDGYLYIGTGDGGSAGDPHGNGQNKNTLLGKILRIDVNRTDEAGGKPYSIPADNVFATGGGAPEIYAYGLRNPWRFSFDSATGKLWAADVGQNEIEEIDWIENGGNYGWNVKEGSACYEPAQGCNPEGMTDPIWEYHHDQGQSITGGYVYRGSGIPALIGRYVYGDYVSGKIWALRVPESGEPDNRLLLESKLNLTSFGTDGSGKLYLCTPEEIYRIALVE